MKVDAQNVVLEQALKTRQLVLISLNGYIYKGIVSEYNEHKIVLDTKIIFRNRPQENMDIKPIEKKHEVKEKPQITNRLSKKPSFSFGWGWETYGWPWG
jgi:hypothetical protein